MNGSLSVSPCASGRFPALYLTTLALLAALAGQGAGLQGWRDYRGPWGNGHAVAPNGDRLAGLPLHWSETSNVTWKTEIPLVGLSSPVVLSGQVWLTTATEEGHDFFAVCVDAANGKILSNKPLFHSDNPEPLGNGKGVNSYATPSPVIEAGRVYLHFGRFGTACLDTSNFEVLWQRTDLICRHYRGPASSPILWQNFLILTMDGVDQQYLVALDKQTGKTMWRTDRSVKWNDLDSDVPMIRDGDRHKAHSTPLIATVNGEPQLFSVGAQAAYGYNPATGQELWRVEFNDWSAAPRPIYDNGRVYFITGFGLSELWAVRVNGRGNVTDTHVDWRIKPRVPKYSTPILVDDLLYMTADESFVSCLDPKTGETIWNERIGGTYRASPLFADGRIYFFSLEGTTTVIKQGRTFELLATNVLATDPPGDDTKRGPGFMASPAVAGHSLFLRSRYYLYRIEEKR